MANKLVKPYTVTVPFASGDIQHCLTVIHLKNMQIQVQGPLEDLAYCKALLEHGIKRMEQYHANKTLAEAKPSGLMKPEEAERLLRETSGGGQA